MDKKLQVNLPTDKEIEDVNVEVEEYIERIFDSPEEYREVLHSSKFSEPLAGKEVS